MTIETQTFNGRRICKLSGALSIWDAAPTWQQLNDLLHSKSKEPVDIDFSGVESCDCAGLQIVCQIRNVAEKKKDRIQITGLSEPLSAVMRQSGLDPRSFGAASEKE